jgi:penicillin-binding protein-related factor A (putative recombinase)
MDLVVYMYEVFYKKNNPSFKKFISEKYNEWCLDKTNDCILATIIRNLLSLQSCYYIENPEKTITTKKKPIKILYLDKDIEKYKTKECDDDNMRPNWRFLSKVCIYPIYNIDSHQYNHLFDTNSNKQISEKIVGIKPENKTELLHSWLYHWEYYSAISPIWKTRIENAGGTLNHETKQIDFISEESREQYYEKYGYEPDEQTNEIERFCIGVCTEQFTRINNSI